MLRGRNTVSYENDMSVIHQCHMTDFRKKIKKGKSPNERLSIIVKECKRIQKETFPGV